MRKRKKPLEDNFHQLKCGRWVHNLAKKSTIFGLLDRECEESTIHNLSTKLDKMDNKYNIFKYDQSVSPEFKREYKCRLEIVRHWRDLKRQQQPIKDIDVIRDNFDNDGKITIHDTDRGYRNLYICFSEVEDAIITYDSDGYQIDFQSAISSASLEEEESLANWHYWSSQQE